MTPSELQAENERLRAELEEAKAETCACLKFLECELGWEDFRAEMLYASKPEARSTSERNAEKLLAFLKEKGHGVRFLAEIERLQRECLEWQAALHHAETEARQCGFTGSIREPGPALLEILAERDKTRVDADRKQRYIDGCRQLIGTQDNLETAIEELLQKRDRDQSQITKTLSLIAHHGFGLYLNLNDAVRQVLQVATHERIAEEQDITVQHLMWARNAIDSTDARKWLREEKAKELEAMRKDMRKRVWIPSEDDYQELQDGAVPCWWIDKRIAELRWEEGA